jgi:hypothetical protein
MDKFEEGRLAGLEEAAKICDALYGRHNEWATTTSKTVKTKADRAEMKGRADAAQFLAHRIRALASTPAPASAQDDLVKAHEIAAEAVWDLAGGVTGTSFALKNADPVSLQTVDGREEFGDGWFVVNRPIMVAAGFLPSATGGAK